jgi:hypothetical protein
MLSIHNLLKDEQKGNKINENITKICKQEKMGGKCIVAKSFRRL